MIVTEMCTQRKISEEQNDSGINSAVHRKQDAQKNIWRYKKKIV